MGTFIKGAVVVVPFPFSDLSATKKRPALLVTTLTGDEVILCQITSQVPTDPYGVALLDSDFASGRLRQSSYIRPNEPPLHCRFAHYPLSGWGHQTSEVTASDGDDYQHPEYIKGREGMVIREDTRRHAKGRRDGYTLFHAIAARS